MSATILNVFSVPLVSAQRDDCAVANAELRQFFLDCEAQGDRYANPRPFTQRNRTVFESRFTLFDWEHPAVRSLRDFCLRELFHAVAELNGYYAATLGQLCVEHESWFHVTRRGGYFGIHNHPMHSWAGVYCVCQEGDEDNEESGRLTFLNPFAAHTMFVDQGNARLARPFQLGSLPTRLSPGQLVLFPAWLLHTVTPFEPSPEGVRITVAFNARFRPVASTPPAVER